MEHRQNADEMHTITRVNTQGNKWGEKCKNDSMDTMVFWETETMKLSKAKFHEIKKLD